MTGARRFTVRGAVTGSFIGVGGLAGALAGAIRGTLPAYFRRRVGRQILAVLAVLTALMQLFELLDVTTEVLKRGLGARGLLHYAVLRLPGELVVALPLSVLLGSMTALHSMARHLEIATVRAAGVTLPRVFGYGLPVMLALAATQFVLADRVLPHSENALKEWWNASAPPDATKARLWALTDSGPVSIDDLSADGRHLRGVRLYERTDAGRIAARRIAKTADWTGSAWRLQDVSELRIDGADAAAGGVERRSEPTRVWTTNLRPDDVLRLDVARPQLSSMMLADMIAGNRVGTQTLAYYRTVLARTFVTPFGVVLEWLLALPVAAWLARGSGGGREMLTAFVLGLAYLLCDGIVASLGTSGRLPPLAAALAAPALFAVIGAWRLRASERR